MSRAPSPLILAQQHAASGRLDDAIALLMRHLRQSPRDVDATVSLALFLVRQGNFDRAEFYFARAAELAPTNAAIRSNHGHALMVSGRTDEAIISLRHALRLDSKHALAYTGLAQCLNIKGDFGGTKAAADECIRNCPGFPDIYDELSRARLQSGDSAGAVDAARSGIALAPGNQRLRASLAVALTYCPDVPPAEVAAAYLTNGRAMAARAAVAAPFPNTRDPDRPLRIGYLSSDLREHSVSYFIEPILANHDPDRARVFCYSAGQEHDAASTRLKSLVTSRGGAWMDALKAPPGVIADRIRADHIDILIELGGHSSGSKLSVVLVRPAPVIATYLGWPTTTGLPMVDWRIVDSITDPQGYESHSTEKLVRLDGAFLCYAGVPDAPPPAQPQGPAVFGSFNSVAKINASCIRAWSNVLNATPGSRMILKAAQLEHAHVRDPILAMFASHGVDASRIQIMPRIASARQHLETYNRIDVALDTFPYNGTTTTCEALWMGVPVITVEGAMHAGRVGKSLLSAINMPECCAPDEPAFVRIASQYASDRTRLSELRRTLRPRMAASALCDGAAFTRKLESAYRDMWRSWCSSRPAT